MTFILASASPRRLSLLESVRLTPERIVPAMLDETPLKGELPQAHAERLSHAKAEAVAAMHPNMPVLAADTVVACGRRILPKAEDINTARACLKLLSGRRHRVYTAVTLMLPGGTALHKTALSLVQFKRLSHVETEAYLASGEWQGKAGGYAIQGLAAGFIPWISGSHSNIVGLPLYEVMQMLKTSRLAI